MDTLFEFFSFGDPNIKYVVIGSVILSASSAIVGSFIFLRKKALVGDAVSHAVLPGICLAFMIQGYKNPLVLIIGAFITGWISLVFIDWVVSRSKIKEDSAIGLTLSVFFGVGILLLTIIQQSGNAAQSGLDQFLFGNAAALIGSDLIYFSIIGLVLLFATVLLFKEFSLISFDQDFAQAIGVPVRALELVLTSLTVLAVVAGIQAVGVVLMAAMLITPAAAARFWTESLRVMIFLAAIIGIISGISGAFVSYAAPSMPTGPWIVMIASIIALTTFFVAPKKGIIAKSLRQRLIRRKILRENILKAFFHLGEEDQSFYAPRSVEQISTRRSFIPSELRSGLQMLDREDFIDKEGNLWKLTEAGFNKGKRITKLHRLWELYLTEYMNIAQDHVHDDAETIEHILTPEIEQKLMEKLEYPTVDPHKSVIP